MSDTASPSRKQAQKCLQKPVRNSALKHRRGKLSNPGFTLIELLVAITILAVVAVLGWRGLDSIVRARIALTENLDLTRAMQLSFAQMQSDCAQVVSTATMSLRHPALIATQDRVTMVRSVNVEDQPNRLQVVTYRVRNGVLSRQESAPTRDLIALETDWQAASAIADNARALTLQSDVTAMTVRLWQQNGWRTPPGPDENVQQGNRSLGDTINSNGTVNPANDAATGLEISLQLRGRSTVMRKIFLLGAI